MDLFFVGAVALVTVGVLVNGVLARTTPVAKLAPGSWANPMFLAQFDAQQPQPARAAGMPATGERRPPQIDALLADALTETMVLRKEVSDLRNKVETLADEISELRGREAQTLKRAA